MENRPAHLSSLSWIFATFVILSLMLAVTLLPHTHESKTTLSISAFSSPATILERQLRHIQGNKPTEEHMLHISLGNIHNDQGRYSAAIKHYITAHELMAQFGDDHSAAIALKSLGIAEFNRGTLVSAQQALEKALSLTGNDNDFAMDILWALANVRREQGQLDAARDLYAKAWEIGLAQGTSVTDRLPSLQTDIGEAHARRGDFKQAVNKLEVALVQQEGVERRLGESVLVASGSSQLAATCSALGAVYHWQGDVDRAFQLYKRAMRIQNATVRQDHPEFVNTKLCYIRALRDLGQTEKALETVADLETALRSGPQEGPDLSRALITKGDLLRESMRLGEAEVALQEANKLQKVWFSEGDNPELATALNVYGSLLHDQGQLKRAHKEYRRSLEINLRTVGNQHPGTAAAYNSLGTLYADMGNDDAAEIHYRKCLEIQLRVMPSDSADLGTSYDNLATVLYRRGSLNEASVMLQRALDVMDMARVPKDNPDRELYRDHLDEVLNELNTPHVASDTSTSTSFRLLATSDAMSFSV